MSIELRNIEDRGSRFRAREGITFAASGAVVPALRFVFRDRLGRVTVAFGVAGA